MRNHLSIAAALLAAAGLAGCGGEDCCETRPAAVGCECGPECLCTPGGEHNCGNESCPAVKDCCDGKNCEK